jgi:hypothetical protein
LTDSLELLPENALVQLNIIALLNQELNAKMLKSSLICHVNTPSSDVYLLDVAVNSLTGGCLKFNYHLTGNIAQLSIPVPKAPTATDGLWEHTCFEAFIAVEGETRYHEFNFSPSGQWATYAFSRTRERCAWSIKHPPIITFKHNRESLLLEAIIHSADLPPNSAHLPLQLGLSAVLETPTGNRSYWALQHPASNPDFHNRAGFILTLNPF